MSEKIDYSKGIYDARQLGTGRMLVLGVQHMFAMFGATVPVWAPCCSTLSPRARSRPSLAPRLLTWAVFPL